jgi:hypothetical protein
MTDECRYDYDKFSRWDYGDGRRGRIIMSIRRDPSDALMGALLVISVSPEDERDYTVLAHANLHSITRLCLHSNFVLVGSVQEVSGG